MCILHYIIRLWFEALSCSRFQNISNGRCVVGACSAAARKSREGREPSLMSVYHYTLSCIFPVYRNRYVKIWIDILKRSCVGQNSAWPILSAGQRKVPAGSPQRIRNWSMYMALRHLSAWGGDLRRWQQKAVEKTTLSPPWPRRGLFSVLFFPDPKEITYWAHLSYQ